MGPLIRLRVRGRTVRWLVAVVLAVGAGALTASTVQRAEEVRAGYGERRTVPVAAADLAVGVDVTEADVRWIELPVAALPGDVAGDPVGRVVTEPIVHDEVMAERRLGGADAEGPAALVPPGGRALAVPVDTSTPTLAVGDRVDVYSPVDLVGAASAAELARASASGARRVAREARVLAVDDQAVTVAVSVAEAPAVARAVLDGAVVLALVAPG
ncbi:MAG TPA: SAF domain-containing protein [Acidimicrobiales bacterium]